MKRRFTQWLLEKCLIHVLGQKPKSIRSKNKNTLTVEITNDSQSNKINKLRSIISIFVQVTKSTKA